MRYLVTGGSGMLGSSVCQQLLASGHEPVSFDVAMPSKEAGVPWARGDMQDGLALIGAASRHSSEGIIHLASVLGLECDADPRLAIGVNSIGMVNALETARILGIRRFIWASSSGVFNGYRGDTPVGDDAPFRPNSIYGGTKILNEMVAEHYYHAFGIETVGFRFTLMMGAGKSRGLSGLLSTELIDKPVRGQPGKIPYDRDDAPSWLWVDDAARAVTLAATSNDASATRVYNIGGDVRSFRDAVKIVQELIPDARVEFEAGIFGLNHGMETGRLERELGFTPAWTLEAQIKEVVELARRNREASSMEGSVLM